MNLSNSITSDLEYQTFPLFRHPLFNQLCDQVDSQLLERLSNQIDSMLYDQIFFKIYIQQLDIRP
jgi:hypothetical protein